LLKTSTLLGFYGVGNHVMLLQVAFVKERHLRYATLSINDIIDLLIRRFYIKLGRYLLDRSFVLNSNSILIYWYSFTSNELYVTNAHVTRGP
jgi:hypothetical protein